MGTPQKQLDRFWRGLAAIGNGLMGGDLQVDAQEETLVPEDDDLTGEDWTELDAEDYLHRRVTIEMARRLLRHGKNRNLRKVQEILPELVDHLDRFPGQISKTLQDRALLLHEELDELQPVLLFEHQQPDRQHEPSIDVPRILIDVSDELIAYLAQRPSDLYSLEPRAFEELMAYIFQSFGFEVELTARSGDGGKDLIAISSNNGIEMRLLVECKRYARHNKVGVGLVRELYGVKQFERATKVILATTSYFEPAARQLEKQLIHELQLKDYDAVVAWIRETAKRRHYH